MKNTQKDFAEKQVVGKFTKDVVAAETSSALNTGKNDGGRGGKS